MSFLVGTRPVLRASMASILLRETLMHFFSATNCSCDITSMATLRPAFLRCWVRCANTICTRLCAVVGPDGEPLPAAAAAAAAAALDTLPTTPPGWPGTAPGGCTFCGAWPAAAAAAAAAVESRWWLGDCVGDMPCMPCNCTRQRASRVTPYGSVRLDSGARVL